MPLPSAIDGIHFPSLEIVDGGSGYLGIVVSEWREGECKRAYALRFYPEAYCAVDEATYSLRTPDASIDRTSYLQVAPLSPELSGLAETRSMIVGKNITLKQYLLVGLSECLEVFSEEPPRVTSHATYEAARIHAASREMAQ